MSTLSRNDIAHLAKLARLEVTDEQAERWAGQLTNVVSYVEQLQQVDTTGVTTDTGVSGLQNILMADEMQPENDLANISQAELLKNVPAKSGTFLEVRAVLSTEGGEA